MKNMVMTGPITKAVLSIPKIREDIYRAEEVTIEFLDENFQTHKKTFNRVLPAALFCMNMII